jgi:hypothetical protein
VVGLRGSERPWLLAAALPLANLFQLRVDGLKLAHEFGGVLTQCGDAALGFGGLGIQLRMQAQPFGVYVGSEAFVGGHTGV